MPRVIRHLSTADLDALLELYRHLHVADDPLPERSVIEAVWREVISSKNHRCYGVFVDDGLVSSCVLTLVPNLTRGCRPYGIIENVVTHAAHRRRGHGMAMLEVVLDEAWAANCYKVMLMTGRKEDAVVRFYEAVGFSRHDKQAFVAKPTGRTSAAGS